MIVLGASRALATTKTVQVGPGGSFTFSPASVTVNVGDTVEWRWMSGPHTTTRSQGPETWDSGIASAPNVFSHTFMKPGTFPYVCTIHQALGMTGTVHVVTAPMTSTTLMSGPTTTLASSAPCQSIQACETELANVLPTHRSAQNAKQRKTARMLDHFARVAEHQLTHVETAQGPARTRAAARAKRALEHLERAADKADASGSLGVPVGPIDSSITALLAFDH